MDPIIITAIIGAIATITVAIIGAWVSIRKSKRPMPKPVGPNYQDLSDAFRLGVGMSAIILAASMNPRQFQSSLGAQRNIFLGLVARIFSQEKFPSLYTLVQHVFDTGEFDAANTLHQEITNAIFDFHPPATQVAYVFGVYIPSLESFDQDSVQTKLTLQALTPLRGTVHKASSTLPKNIVGWYENILEKHNMASAASNITKWFDSLKSKTG